MSLELLIPIEKIDENLLWDVYKMFCEAYDTKPSLISEKELKTKGMEELRVRKSLDYRPKDDMKFIIQDFLNEYSLVWGYTMLNDPLQKEKDEKFVELMNKYLSNK